MPIVSVILSVELFPGSRGIPGGRGLGCTPLPPAIWTGGGTGGGIPCTGGGGPPAVSGPVGGGGIPYAPCCCG